MILRTLQKKKKKDISDSFFILMTGCNGDIMNILGYINYLIQPVSFYFFKCD